MTSDDARTWRTSTFSQSDNQCVEVAEGTTVLIRDTKHEGRGPIIEFSREQWLAFLRELSADQMPTDNGAVQVTLGELVIDFPSRKDVPTQWHVRSLATDVELHFDDGEWSAFLAGVQAGQFDLVALAAG